MSAIDRHRYRCSKKRAHATLDSALAAVAATWAYKGVPLYPYLCRWCGLWHLGGNARAWAKEQGLQSGGDDPMLMVIEA